MGITDNLQINLRQNSEKNKQALTKKYQEHSLWLQNELNSIKNLMTQNPREKLNFNCCPSSSTHNLSEDLDEIPAPAAPAAMNKRKSPECSLSPSHLKDSPNQKRSALTAATDHKSEESLDLPTDLTKLNKSQLFSHLQLRGATNFNFKMKKNELIDILSLHLARSAGTVDEGVIQTKCSNETNEEVLHNTVIDANSSDSAKTTVITGDAASSTQQENETLVNVSLNPTHVLKAESLENDATTAILSQPDVKLQQKEEKIFNYSSKSSALIITDTAVNPNERNGELKTTVKVVGVETNSTLCTMVSNAPNKVAHCNTANVPVKKPVNLSNQSSFLLTEKHNKTIIPALEQARLLREKDKVLEKIRIAKLAEESKQKKTTELNSTNSILTKQSLVSNITPSASTKLPNCNGIKPPITIPVPSGLPSKKIPMNVLNIFNKKGPTETASNTNVDKLIVETTKYQSETKAEIANVSSSLNQFNNCSTPTASQQKSAVVIPPSAAETTTAENKISPVQLTEQNAPSITEQQSSYEEYQIEDRNSSDGSDSGTDDDERKRPPQKIPEWAKGTQLKEALDRQYGTSGGTPMDPDLIFPEVRTCSLEEIFGANCGKSGKQYSKRTSSAKWDEDELTLIEKRNYRVQMGYGGRA